jgi:hypothetical protein
VKGIGGGSYIESDSIHGGLMIYMGYQAGSGYPSGYG